jgi:protein TonB
MDQPPGPQMRAQAGPQRAFLWSGRDGARFASLVLTIAAHLGLVAAFLFGVRVAVPVTDAKPLAISIARPDPLPRPILSLMPRMSAPRAIQVPVPEFTIQPEPSPVLATFSPSSTGLAGKGGAGAGAPMGCASCYLDLVRRYLLQFWVYPREAADRHVQGVVDIHFISDRAGNVISVEVSKSSGHQLLDDAALSLIRRAGKIPPIPADLPVALLNTTVPIGYNLTPNPEDVESHGSSARTGRFGR